MILKCLFMYYLANFSHGARSIESYNYQFGPYPKRVTCATCQVYSKFIHLKKYSLFKKNIFLGKHTNCDSNWRNYSTSSMVDGCTFMYVRVNSTLLPTYFEIYHIGTITYKYLKFKFAKWLSLESFLRDFTNLDFR